MKKLVIKRRGYTEEYDEKKIYASCYAAALNSNYSERRAEKLASKVTKSISKWVNTQIKGKKRISSDDLKDKIVYYIDDNEVAFMYKHHLDIC